VALGVSAGRAITTGSYNVMIGNRGRAGDHGTTRIGRSDQGRAFIHGIRGVTTGVANAVTVVVDSAGQLGTVSSSRRYKEDIQPMADRSVALHDLRPVTFRYKEAYEDGTKPIQYGLIAEEVAEVFPDLAVYNEDGTPEMVKYQVLSSLLLNEFLKLSDDHEALQSAKDAEIAALESTIAGLAGRLASLEAKVSAPVTAGEVR